MSTDPTDTPEIIRISDAFYVRVAVDNIAWVDLGEYAIIVDALEQTYLEEEVFTAIRSTLGERPIRYVLNTHTHFDHIALNDAFHRRYRSEIINYTTTLIPPQGRWFEGARRRVLMLPTVGTHTSQDCCVWVPQDKVLFVGDIFGWGLIPTGDLNPETQSLLEEIYERLIAYEPTVVVPGHGPLLGKAELVRWVEYFRWLRDEVSRSVAAGKTDGEIVEEISPPEDMTSWWRFVQWKHGDSVQKLLHAAHRGWI